MSVSGTAHQTIVTLLSTYGAPSNSFSYVYSKHATASMLLPAVSVEVVSSAPIKDNVAINTQELLDNRLIVLSVKIHTAYRKGPSDPDTAVDLSDEVITALRKNVNLAGSYHVFEVMATAHNVEHDTSGTTGTELLVNIHKAVFYEQDS